MAKKVYSFIGACFLFTIFLFPAAAFAEKVVVLDPGHGGRFTGTCGYTKESPKDLCERDVNLEVGLKVKQALQFSGIKVFMTRETDVDFAPVLSGSTGDLAVRTNLSNGFVKGNNDNSIFISIHHNASPTSPYVKGYETYYYDPAISFEAAYPHDPIQATYTQDSRRLAETIHPVMVRALGSIDRKIISRNFYVIRNAQMPSVLLELGYMTNREEESRIKTAQFQQQAAQGIADSIKAYFKVFEVYQNNNRVATFKTKEEAILYAQKQSGEVYVFDKDAQTIVWENSKFEVYHKSMGLLKSFGSEQTATAYAAEYANTRVVEKDTGLTIWANYFSQKYQVQDSEANNTSFYDLNKALEFAKTKQNARVVRTDINETVWTNFPGEQISRNVATARLSGTTRYDTSVSISKMIHPAAMDSAEKTVILTTGMEPADALSSGPLAALYGDAPILLNQNANLLPEVKAELIRLGAKKVVIIGGTLAIPQTVENEIKALGMTTERIAGQNRLETNMQIVNKLQSVNGVFVASARSFPDALAAAPIAAANNWAVILTEQNGISAEALNYLKGKKVVIVGGPLVISEQVQAQISQQTGDANVVRLSGGNRYETLAWLLWYFKDQMKSNTINIATGTNFPDALAAAPLSIKNKAPLILIGNGLYKNVESFLYQYTEENLITNVNIIGGPLAVSDTLRDVIVNKAK